jgi:predicted nucleotidyltransferase
VSVILFGSAATGGFSGTVSDVDLILVLPADATPEDRRRLRDSVASLETLLGMRQGGTHSPGALESIFNRITATERSYFARFGGRNYSRKFPCRPFVALMFSRPSSGFFVKC